MKASRQAVYITGLGIVGVSAIILGALYGRDDFASAIPFAAQQAGLFAVIFMVITTTVPGISRASHVQAAIAAACVLVGWSLIFLVWAGRYAPGS